MCFSATASFTAGTALIAVGGVSLRRSRGKAELPLALVPLLFGVQQLSEGLLWSIRRKDAIGVFLALGLSVVIYLLAVAASQVSLTTFVWVWCCYAAVLSLLILINSSGPMRACRPELMRARERTAP